MYDYQPRVKVSSLDDQIVHVKRCYDLKIRKLEAEIAKLRERNKDLNAEVAHLEKTNWKRKYEKLKAVADDMRGRIREAIYDEED